MFQRLGRLLLGIVPALLLVGIAGGNDHPAPGQVENGELTVITSDGATIQGSYRGTVAPLPEGQLQLNVHVLWFDGTDRLAGVTGEADVVAIIDAPVPGAALRAEGAGFLSFQ